jgi:hypothetical protein
MSETTGYAAVTFGPTEAWVCQPDVRYVQLPPSPDIMALLHGTSPEPRLELQQAWREYFTGRIEWRAVPTVVEPAA